MKIKKITLYNVPFRYSSQDRIIDKVDTKIERWKKEEFVATEDNGNYSFDKIGWDITNGFEGSITINSTKRFNYARLETDLYGDKVVYVFLHSVGAYESSTGFKYNIKIDVMASFGKELLDSMNGKNVLIDRLHEDRYKLDANGDMIFNIANHGLINSDFNVGDSYGQKILTEKNYNFVVSRDYQNTGQFTNYISNNFPLIYETTNDRPPSHYFYTGANYASQEIIIDNSIEINGVIYYVYALIAAKGEPYVTPTIDAIDVNFRKDDVLICPINKNFRPTYGPYPPGEGADLYYADFTNGFSIFENMQEGKVINIVTLPFQLNTTNNFIVNDKPDAQIARSFEFTSEENNNAITWTQGINSFNDEKRTKYLVGFRFNYAIGKQLINNISKDMFGAFNLILDKTKKDDLKLMLQDDRKRHFELSMLNKGITPISMYHEGKENPIDLYAMLRENQDLQKKLLNVNYAFSEDGLKASIELNNGQFVDIESFNNLAFYTDAGKSYLAQNGAYLNAQKRGIELQGEMQKLQARSQRWQNASSAANPISTVFSLGTSLIGGAAAASYNTKELGQIDKITENEKAKIDAHITDLQHTSPMAHAGNSKGWGWTTATEGFKSKFLWLMRYPSDMVANKIYNYLQKHGYRVDDWMTFSSALYTSRKEWNMLTISNAQDFIPQTDYDDSIINEFVTRLGAGVRIWHKDDFTIDYTKLNIENSLDSWLNS